MLLKKVDEVRVLRHDDGVGLPSRGENLGIGRAL